MAPVTSCHAAQVAGRIQLRESCPLGSAAVSSRGVRVDEARAPHGVVLLFSPYTGKFPVVPELGLGALNSDPCLPWVPDSEVWEGAVVFS